MSISMIVILAVVDLKFNFHRLPHRNIILITFASPYVIENTANRVGQYVQSLLYWIVSRADDNRVDYAGVPTCERRFTSFLIIPRAGI
jgi:hypothetical protein